MNLQYPIGEFTWPESISDQQLENWIDRIASLPTGLRAALTDLNDAQLDTPYRPDGWTLRQVVHHLADSHMNSYIRFKLALTEDLPTIRPYDEAAWAELHDAKSGPIAVSLNLLENLHQRWSAVLRSLGPEELARKFNHPDWEAPVRLDQNIALYAWHGEHHLAHITSTRDREGW